MNKRAALVIISMRSLISIEQQSPRSPCDILVANVGPEVAKTAKTVILLNNNNNNILFPSRLTTFTRDDMRTLVLK